MTLSSYFTNRENKPDAIMAAKAAYESDPRDGKIATFIGQITDPETGQAFMPSSVRTAMEHVIHCDSKYVGSKGDPGYLDAYAQHILFGEEQWGEMRGRTVAVQSNGGTGALHLAKRLIMETSHASQPDLLLDPGWPNHAKIFRDFNIHTYGHEDPETHEYNHDACLEMLRRMRSNAYALLQTAGYNGDGIERTQEQWEEILELLQQRELIPVFDTAYNGLAEGWEQDVTVLREAVRRGLEVIVCASNSKNAGLYGYRTGAMYVTNVQENAVAGMTGYLANDVVRPEYSNPSKIGSAALSTVLKSEALRQQFRDEVDAVRTGLIASNREAFVDGINGGFEHLRSRKGIFLSVGAMTDDQHESLQGKGVYGLKNGRVCVGSLNPKEARVAGEMYGEVLRNA